MKTELNYSLRLRFFAQYLNSCDCGDHGESFRTPWDSRAMLSFLEAEQEQAFLFLRPLSSITDEEAIEVAKLCGYGKNKRTLDTIKREVAKGFSVIEFDDENSLEIDLVAFDYLRSIGVALPFMGHSVEELIEAGWIKLTD